MSHTRSSLRSSRLAALLAVAAVGLTAACSHSSHPSHDGMSMDGSDHVSDHASDHASDHGSMPGMAGHSGYDGTGLAASEDGYTLTPLVRALSTGTQQIRFQIRDSEGRPVTDYVEDQTKELHLYLIRQDLTGYQHLHPTLDGDTWSLDVDVAEPGPYRMYTDFIARSADGTQHPLVLSTVLTAPGSYTPQSLPPVATSTTVDGLTATFTGDLAAGRDSDLTVQITSDGRPVSDLQPYLDTYAHLTAVHVGDAAYRHVHPEQTATASKTGGPELHFTVDLPEKGRYRFFLQVQRAGTLHTLPITLQVS